MMKALWQGQVVAESTDTVIVEGNHYFPKESLNPAFFKDSNKTTVCSWKGTAHYYSLVVNGQTNADAVWYYPEPKTAAREITNRVAFWRGVQVTE